MKIKEKIINEKHFYGVLSIYKDKNKIFENHNMILKPGIELIIECLTSELKLSNCLWKARLGDGSQINSEEFQTEDFVFLKNNNNEEIENFSFVSLSEEITSENKNTIKIFKEKTKNIVVNCSFIGKAEGQVFEVNEFGLFFQKPEENNEKIFSRVILDPFVLIPDEEYTIEYKIYF